MLHSIILYAIYMVVALILTTEGAPKQNLLNGRSSPCPDLFQYKSVSEGEWTGNVLLQTDDDLHGVWVRLVFDSEVKKVLVDGDYEVVIKDNGNEVGVRNRNVLFKAGTEKNIKITVKYDGNKVPNLRGFRLNARVQCPEANSDRTDFFHGDNASRDFLTTVLSNIKPTHLKTEYQCGITTSNSIAYPWQASVLIKQDNTEQYTCGAILISPGHLLTAAHCVTFENDDVAVLPESVLVTSAEGKTLAVAKVKVHPGYDSSTLFNDVAILQLKTVVSVNDNLRPICLSNEPGPTTTSVLTGYSIQDGKIGSELTEASVEKLDSNDCLKRAPELETILGDDSYCVSYLSDNTNCVGDSGSSLISQSDDTSTLKGIVSIGGLLQNKAECKPGNVVVVTDITKHLKWILRSIN